MIANLILCCIPSSTVVILELFPDVGWETKMAQNNVSST